MTKKKLITFIALLAIGFIIYRVMNAPKKELIEVRESETAKVADKNIPSSLKVGEIKPIEKTKVEIQNNNFKLHSTPDAQMEAFDKMEKNWLSEVKGIVGESVYPKYLEMRERNEKEKMQAYKEYHDYLRQKFGDKFSYNISEDQSLREKQINQKYLKELLSIIGAESFKRYTALKDNYNEKMRRENKESIQIEF